MNQENLSPARPAKTLDAHLLTYALAGGAILAGSSPANAAVIYYSGPTLDTAGTFFDLDLNTDLFTDFTFNSENAVNGGFNATVSFPGTNGVTGPLAFGDTIGTASSFSTSSPYKISKASIDTAGTITPSGNYPIGSDQYMGLQFDVSGSTHYAWALIQVSTSATFNDPDWTGVINTQVKQFGYESVAGADILAGATSGGASEVPEPSSLAMFALGAAGIAALRRRRKSS